MDEITRGASKLAIRSQSKANERRRLHSEKDYEHERKPGFLNSIKRLFSNDTKEEVGKLDVLQDSPEPAVPSEPLFHAFVPVPGLLLPGVDDDHEFPQDMCDYMYYYQATVPSHLIDPRGLSATQRQRMVAFIAERHAEHSQPLETFHLAVFIMDMMMIQRRITIENAEYVCISALSLAAKTERQLGLSRSILREYKLRERLNMENNIFRWMDFSLGRHTVVHLMRVLYAAMCKSSQTKDQEEVTAWNAAKILSQVAVMDASLVAGTKPSLIATAVVRLAIALIGRPWTDTYTAHSQHTEDEIRDKTEVLYKYVKKLFEQKTNAMCRLDSVVTELLVTNLKEARKVIDAAY